MQRIQKILFDTALGHQRAGRLADAEKYFHQALTYDPKDPVVLASLGILAHQREEFDKAIDFMHRSIASEPLPETYINLGNILSFIGRMEEAEAEYRKALELRPSSAAARGNLGLALLALGRQEEALEAINASLALEPRNAAMHANALQVLNYIARADPLVVRAQHEKWARLHAQATPIGPHRNTRDPNRVLRIGYVSPDFRRHSVAIFFEPVLASHDRTRFAVYCYSDVIKPDAVTERLMKYPVAWRPITGAGDDQAAKAIYDDNIDILVDLAGHTGRGRLQVFARKPAPVQVTYLGYPNGTGLPAMDYRLTDALSDPPENDAFYVEKLVRLPGAMWCFSPPAQAPDVTPPPHRMMGCITFGCFNNFAKVTPVVLDAWGRILARVPGSRLLLKSRGLQQPSIQARVRDALAGHAVAPERITFSNAGLEYRQHLGMYGGVDVALDTFPYNGTTTTLEAMWMGVPVITLAGRVHSSRVGVSLMAAMDLPHLVAADVDGYVEKAVALAGDSAALASLRDSMRSRVARLTDAPAFTRGLESAYRSMWQTWCAGQP